MAYQGKVKAGDLYGSLYVITIFSEKVKGKVRAKALCWCREWLTYAIFLTDALIQGSAFSGRNCIGRKLPDECIVDKDLSDTLRAYFWKLDERYYRSKEGKLHRIVYEMVTGQPIPKDKVVDHINGNRFDNRFANLRLVNKRQNSLNIKSLSKKVDAPRGVHYCQNNKAWIAQYSFYGSIRIGQYETKEEAHKAWLNYVTLNHPEDIPYLRECISCSTE